MRPFKQLSNVRFKNTGFILLAIITATICFSSLYSGTTEASPGPELKVSSQPVARGSVAASPSAASGQDYICLQSIIMESTAGDSTVTALRITEYGSGTASDNIANVYLYKETNSKSGFQGPGAPGITADTLVPTTPGTFGAGSEETLFTLTNPVAVTATPAVYYIVYTVKNSAVTGATLGSQLADASAITVEAPATVKPFTAALKSNLLTVVATPHSGYSSSTNLCETCHLTHLAKDFSYETTLSASGPNSTRSILNRAYLESPSVVNSTSHQTYNLLCEACHDGTGASTNIKADYDGSHEKPGHMTKHAGTSTSGWKPPSSGQYNAGVAIPCMVCHDVHGSSKGNHAMLSDNLYDYATSPGPSGGGWTDPNGNGKIDNDNEKCLVCHAPATDSTTLSSRTSVVMGIDMKMPTTHSLTSNCSGCHSNVHDLSLAPDGCSSCHLEIHNRSTNAVAGLKSTHTITSDSGNLPPYENGSCTGMCHSNHIHAPTTNNVWVDIANRLSGTASTDYSSTAPGGLCLSCHKDPQTGLSAGTTITTTGLSQSNYDVSPHQYAANIFTHSWDSSSFNINCVKCHRDSDQTTSQSKYGPHASGYKKLSFAGVDATNGYVEEGLCYKCHSTDTNKNPNGASASDNDFYGTAGITMSNKALGIDSVFTGKTYTHPTYDATKQGRHLKMPENEGSSDFATPSNRHAECQDCHDTHSAKAGTHAQGTNAASNVLAGAVGVQPTSGIWPDEPSGTWAQRRQPTSWAQVKGITEEWQLCLKCHSSYTTQPTDATNYPWGANTDANLAANQQTDQALEFNPNNPGRHGVISQLPAGNWLRGKTTPQFTGGWSGDMTMQCSDCHASETSSDSAGPHGSNNQYILRAPWTVNTGKTGTDDDLCFQCHNRSVYGGGMPMPAADSGFNQGTKNLHNLPRHKVACVRCHSFIPHGWKRYKMLIINGTDSAPYLNQGQAVPVLDGNGNFIGTSNSWNQSDCDHSAQGEAFDPCT